MKHLKNNLRNRNIDIIRATALCTVIIYHIWVLSGTATINSTILQTFVTLGGEIGVTAFFIISGVSIYFALNNMEQSDSLKFGSFIKRRMIRILPEYYISILFVLFFSNNAVFLSKNGIMDILLHSLFIHNILPSTSGSINGVLWTMALIAQFYIVAIPIYKLCVKSKVFVPILSIIITVAIKFVLFHYIMPNFEGNLSFWFSRQLFISVLDNFILGMYTAKMISKCKDRENGKQSRYIIGTIISVLILYFVSRIGLAKGIHTDNLSGYTWHSLITLCISFGVYCFANIKLSYKGFLTKILLWLSKYEYGIYIVHLILIQSLLAYSPFVQYNNVAWISYFILFVSSIGMGYLFSLLVNGFRIVYILKDN